MPRENVLGDVGKGYKVAIETLNEGRIGIGAQMLGLAEGALAHALAYAKERSSSAKPLRNFKAFNLSLQKWRWTWKPQKLLVYNAARLRDAGLPFVTEAAMAKYFASQIAERVASRAIEVFGGVGFIQRLSG